MKKTTELGKAMDVINAFIGRKLKEAARIKDQKGRVKFYSCLNEKGFTVHINQYTNKVVSISYTPFSGDCERAYKRQSPDFGLMIVRGKISK